MMFRVRMSKWCVIVLVIVCGCEASRSNHSRSRNKARAIQDNKSNSKNIAKLESRSSHPIVVPDFTSDDDLALIKFENPMRGSKAPKKARGNQTPSNLPLVTAPIAEYMADIMNEIPKNTSKHEREKLIIENLFIEILRDDQLKNQLTEVISNVTKNTIAQANSNIEIEPLISLKNKTRIAENSEDGKRSKGSKKSESTLGTSTETYKENDFITKVKFNLNKNIDSFRSLSSKFFESRDKDKDDEDDSKPQKDELTKKIKNVNNKQDEEDGETIDNKTTIKNDIDDDEKVTVETDESDNETTNATSRKNSSNRKKLPIKSNLETLDERDPVFWYEQGESALRGLLERRTNEKKARNVILFLGDGMSLATVTAARIYNGQQNGHSGEEAQLSFERFPTTGLSKTYCIDKQVADSACSATAYLSGVKTNYGTLGVSGLVSRNDCEAMRNESLHVDSIADWAQACDKSTGLVTTTRVTHATPAALYAHTANRDWESDRQVLKARLDPKECEDIASQLITRAPGNQLNVIMGGGRANFLPEFTMDDEGHHGKRKDKRDLIDIWRQVKLRQGNTVAYVTNHTDLMKLNTSNTEYLLGLFAPEHMDYALDADPIKQPTLAEMTQVAIEILNKNPEGFFLLVEGGRIDHAHHENMAHKALDETVEFSEAVRKATELVDLDETMIVVTADHSHTMTINGYPNRGNDILGVAGNSDVDNSPYTTLSYANGPSSKKKDVIKRYDFSKDNLKYKDYKYPANFASNSESHGGEDVPVFSTGPWSHLLSGVYQQNVIPRVMGFAACIGPGGNEYNPAC